MLGEVVTSHHQEETPEEDNAVVIYTGTGIPMRYSKRGVAQITYSAGMIQEKEDDRYR